MSVGNLVFLFYNALLYDIDMFCFLLMVLGLNEHVYCWCLMLLNGTFVLGKKGFSWISNGL